MLCYTCSYLSVVNLSILSTKHDSNVGPTQKVEFTGLLIIFINLSLRSSVDIFDTS